MSDKKYTKDHEWIKLDENIATIGVTNHAQESLGDIVFIDLPKIGNVHKAGSEVSVIESVKAASDIYSPIDGEITAINESIVDTPELINQSPYDQGWLIKVDSKTVEKDDLMDESSYKTFLNTI